MWIIFDKFVKTFIANITKRLEKLPIQKKIQRKLNELALKKRFNGR